MGLRPVHDHLVQSLQRRDGHRLLLSVVLLLTCGALQRLLQDRRRTSIRVLGRKVFISPGSVYLGLLPDELFGDLWQCELKQRFIWRGGAIRRMGGA